MISRNPVGKRSCPVGLEPGRAHNPLQEIHRTDHPPPRAISRTLDSALSGNPGNIRIIRAAAERDRSRQPQMRKPRRLAGLPQIRPPSAGTRSPEQIRTAVTALRGRPRRFSGDSGDAQCGNGFVRFAPYSLTILGIGRRSASFIVFGLFSSFRAPSAPRDTRNGGSGTRP
jgi:hypothetical protein